MYKNKLKSLFIALSILFFSFFLFSARSQSSILTDSAEARINKNFDLIRSAYQGQVAYDAVAFIEKYWRIAGNTGFDASIDYVVKILGDAGYVAEVNANRNQKLTYRIEKRPMERLTWEPVSASLEMEGPKGFEKILDYSVNRNMIAVNSWSTPLEGVEADLVYVKPGMTEEQINEWDVKGKVVFVETQPWRMFDTYIRKKGALGLIVYSNPEYTQPSKFRNSIQFKTIPQDTVYKAWTIATSFNARDKILKAISKGNVKVRVNIQTKLYKAVERTIIADVRGEKYPEQRIVYSAHIQEPGANDNASGVGALAEMAKVLGELLQSGRFVPARSFTFLFGDEIISTRRYIEEDKERAKGILWGISLDMVGENTSLTGGTFLIEKMPDPSAIWTRGDDHHTEWGGSPIGKEDMKPGYFNSFVEDIFKRQGTYANWEVRTNPYEGGSDHVPFLRANIPGLLLWHFTDAFYHTDGDRIDKVSKSTLRNVGTGALVVGMTLVNSDKALVDYINTLLVKDANKRLMKEFTLSKKMISAGGQKEAEIDILNTWTQYYVESARSIRHLYPKTVSNSEVEQEIRSYQKRIRQMGNKLIKRLDR